MQSTQMGVCWGVEGSREKKTAWPFCLGLEFVNQSIKWYEGMGQKQQNMKMMF